MPNKDSVAIYTQRYLNPTMTFVFYQILEAARDFRSMVLTPNRPDNLDLYPYAPLFYKEKNLLGKFYRQYKKKTGHYAVLSGSQKKYFKELIMQNGTRLIHAHFGPSGIEILPVARELGIPLLVSFHGYDASSLLRNRNYLNDLRGLFEYADIIAVSNAMKENLIKAGADRKRIRVLYYGASVERFLYHSRKPLLEKARDNEEIKFLQISGFTEKKGHEYTVRAFSEFLKEYQNASLTLGGTGQFYDQIVSLVDQLGIRDKVHFIGMVEPKDVPEVMDQADVFLHHSITASSGDQEGIPNAIIEAMATGLPVLSTFHSGIPELIENTKEGFLVKEKDLKGYLEALKEIIHSGGEIPVAARRKVEKEFNLRLQGEKLRNIYREIIRTKAEY